MSITQDDVPPAAIQRVSSFDHIKEGDQIVKGPPVHKHLERDSSAGDFGADAAPSKSANSGFPKLNRNLLLLKDKSVESVPVSSLDPKSKVRSMPGEVTHVGSKKNFSETTNNLSMPVAATMSPVDGPKSVMRSPPSVFGSSPVMAGRVPPLPATTGTQPSTSSTQNVASKRITFSKQRVMSGCVYVSS